MGLFEWIFDNLYIVAVIGFALFSFLGKAAKSADPNKSVLPTGCLHLEAVVIQAGMNVQETIHLRSSLPDLQTPAMMNSMMIGMMTCNMRISMMSRIRSLLHLLAPQLTTEVRAR